MPDTTISTSALLDRLFEDDLAGRCLVAPDGSVLRANAEWLRCTGFQADDVLGADIVDLFPETRDMALAMHARARAGHRVAVPLHAQIVNGVETWWEGSIDPIPMEGGTGLLITAREASGAAPRPDATTAALTDYLYDIGPAGIVLYEPVAPFRVLSTNKAYQEMWPEPLRSRGLVGLALADYVPDVEEAGVAEVFRTVARTGIARNIEEFPFDGFPGGRRWFNWSLSPVVRQGRVVALAHMAVDVTNAVRARRDVEKAVAESRHAAELLELGDPFCELDREFRIIRVNAAHERINGHRREQILGRTHWDVWPDTADPSSPYWREYHRCIDEQVPVQFDAHYAPLDVWTSVSAYPTAEGGIAIFWRDSTAGKRAEAALRNSEQRFKALFTNMTDAFAVGELVRGPDGAPRDFRFVEMNEAFERHTGIERARAVNRPFSAVAPRVERYWLDMYVAVVADGTPRRLTNYNRDTGRYYDVYCYRPEPGRFAIIFSDISETKRRAEVTARNEELLRRLFEQLPVMIAMYDPQLGSFRFNDELRRVLGWTEEDAAAGDFMSMAYPDPVDRAAAVEHMTTLAHGWRELMITAKDGTRFPSSWANIRLSDETRVGIGIDLRERRQAEAALRRSVHELKEAQRELREADRRKDEFLGMLSHELRNPLAPIRNSIYLLERSAPDSAAALRARAVIDRQTEHLASLVDDLLDVTRISRGKVDLQRERLDAREIVRKVTEDLHGVFEHAGVELCVDQKACAPLWVDADATRLAQVLGNLLQNAVKFTPQGGRVGVSLVKDGSWAELRVRDDGIGIDPAQVQRIFQPFVQEEQTLARSKGGLGLGLALVKGLVELHGGTVEGQSAGTGLGAEFIVRLPLVIAGPVATAAAVATAPMRRRIVIIEDNADAADTLAEVLALEGHEVRTARDARSGLALVREERPDVVLCDLGLPDMDGYDVAASLRRDGSLPPLRLIAVSGYAQPEDRERARAAGFDAHVAKPPDLDELRRLLTEGR